MEAERERERENSGSLYSYFLSRFLLLFSIEPRPSGYTGRFRNSSVKCDEGATPNRSEIFVGIKVNNSNEYY